MEQPPFPTALVLLVAFFGFVAITTDALWVRVVAGVATAFVAAAAIYQVLPRRGSHDGT